MKQAVKGGGTEARKYKLVKDIYILAIIVIVLNGKRSGNDCLSLEH